MNLKPDMKSVIPQSFNRIGDTRESRSPLAHPSSTGDPHEQFPEHEVLASTPLSPKRLGIESTVDEFRNSFSEFQARWRNNGGDSNKTPFVLVLSRTLEPTTFDFSL